MVFSSITFLFYFLPIFLLIYHFFPQKNRNYVLLASSIFFYSWGAPKFIAVILASTILDFYLVKLLYNSTAPKARKRILFCSITMNLGLLAFFKYANFFVDNVNAIANQFGAESIAWTKILLPIGISFYTFQTLTYSIDVYRRKHVPLDKLSDYLVYIMSFPQMIAGPIVRYNTIAKQITNRFEKYEDKLIGFYRFSIGLAKKVLIANVMAEQADVIFGNDFSSLSSGQAWLGTIAFTFQIYFDFSGYSDMAIGLGKMMGFSFPENFDSPYTSRSITEFWRRWHITLGDFMRDYLYIPLGGNRVSSASRLYTNLIIVFLLSGLWHGDSWNFMFWGAFHGIFLILDRLFLKKVLDRIGFFAVPITFFIVMIGWVIFKIESTNDIPIYLNKLFSMDFSSKVEYILKFKLIAVFAVVFSFVTLLKFGRKLQAYYFERSTYSSAEHTINAIIAMLLIFLSASSIVASEFNPFIYFRF